jgi:hypothetical protein
MRKFFKTLGIIFIWWVGLNLFALILDGLFSNDITAAITVLAFFALITWSLIKVAGYVLTGGNKEGNK